MRAGNIELSLCAAAGAAAAGLAWSKYERGHFVTEELVFSSSKLKSRLFWCFYRIFTTIHLEKRMRSC